MGSPSILTNPMFNMGFLLVSMQLAKKIDWEDPNVLTYARIGYYGAQVLVVALAYGLITLIRKKNGKLSQYTFCVYVCVWFLTKRKGYKRLRVILFLFCTFSFFSHG